LVLEVFKAERQKYNNELDRYVAVKFEKKEAVINILQCEWNVLTHLQGKKHFPNIFILENFMTIHV
jgi:predicted Ser/Thr protein kinase